MKLANLFMDVAIRTAQESNCVKYQVGAVLVKDNRIILQGYNGTISKFTNCCDKFHNFNPNSEKNREEHSIWSNAFEVHAEMNIITHAAKKGISLENGTMYCTHTPCNNCLKHLVQAGIKEIYYLNDYIDNSNLQERLELLDFIKLVKYDSNK